MHGEKLFQELNKEEKINFFLQCQSLLISHHPHSEFVFRANNFKERLNHVLQFTKKYKGFFYQSENLCVLYNYIKVENEREEPVLILKKHMYQPPTENYNAIVIDFVVFRKLNDCIEFYKFQRSSMLKYALFVRNSKVKLYTMNKLLGRLNIPL